MIDRAAPDNLIRNQLVLAVEGHHPRLLGLLVAELLLDLAQWSRPVGNDRTVPRLTSSGTLQQQVGGPDVGGDCVPEALDLDRPFSSKGERSRDSAEAIDQRPGDKSNIDAGMKVQSRTSRIP